MVTSADEAVTPAPLGRTAGRAGLGAFAVFVVVGLAGDVTSDPSRAAAGAVVALAGGMPLFLTRSRLTIVYAAIATAGVTLLANANAHDIAWFALVIVAGWCVLAGGLRCGLAYWVGCLLLFGGEWLWAVRDPGWAPWSAGLTAGVVGTVLIRRELLLVEALQAAQAGLAERSRADERSRIAHELHDVIAHSLTVSLLHISSARIALEHDPADASRALAEAERLGRQSLAEVRATMGLLASEAPNGVAPPVPEVGALPALVEQLRRAGSRIDLVVDGPVSEVPATVGATIYRVVQEALTNATRHAPGAPVDVRIRAAGGQVLVEVDSAGPPGEGTGLGLESMRERARAVGGTCGAGPGGRGWVVRADLPVVAAGTADRA